jgi:hypothetical protein
MLVLKESRKKALTAYGTVCAVFTERIDDQFNACQDQVYIWYGALEKSDQNAHSIEYIKKLKK